MSISIKSISGRKLYVSDASSVSVAVQEAVRADANLRGADLGGADLRDAYLGGAYLRDAYLRGADLRDAYLGGADLRGANLRDAYLGGANLRDAYLGGADLRDAHLGGADLRGADLGGANLGGADLRGADLGGADLGGAYLRDAYLRDAKNLPPSLMAQVSILPAGVLIGWKKARDFRIVKLRIPEGAQRSNSTGRKCRADHAEVLAVYGPNGDSLGEASSQYDPRFRYVPGETVVPLLPFDTNPWVECASGIHFFITREEADDYQ